MRTTPAAVPTRARARHDGPPRAARARLVRQRFEAEQGLARLFVQGGQQLRAEKFEDGALGRREVARRVGESNAVAAQHEVHDRRGEGGLHDEHGSRLPGLDDDADEGARRFGAGVGEVFLARLKEVEGDLRGVRVREPPGDARERRRRRGRERGGHGRQHRRKTRLFARDLRQRRVP
ncbi:MAG TPA: hypothetical protein VK422_08040 [Pyrinomonadaceae bacterium]|nr:hypothetical protein [Pyrinomonadaceae bacterium]